MKIVIDTNLIVSALLWHGAPHRLLDRLRDGAASWVMSPALLEEFDEVIHRGKLARPVAATGVSADRMVARLRKLAALVDAPRAFPQAVARDPDDDAVLACALAAQADLIVSGDKDLLVLGHVQGIPIVTVHEALARIG